MLIDRETRVGERQIKIKERLGWEKRERKKNREIGVGERKMERETGAGEMEKEIERYGWKKGKHRKREGEIEKETGGGREKKNKETDT